MRAACVAVALALVLCAGCATAFSPHRAMKARGPVSPFPLEPAADAAAPAGEPVPPAPPIGKYAQPKVPQRPAYAIEAHAAAVAFATKQVNGFVDQYFKRWDYAGGATPFNAKPAMDLYVDTPKIHDLMLNFKALKHGHVTFDYTGPEAKAKYAEAMNKLYNSVASFRLTEVPGTRVVKVDDSLRRATVTVDFDSAVTPKLVPVAVPLPGRALLTFELEDGRNAATSFRWNIKTEKLSVRAPAAVAAVANAVRHPIATIKAARAKHAAKP